jgi:rhodanese-related sulfurtransferase
MLFALQLIVNSTHFCLASFMIELALKMVGRSLPTELIDGAEARQLVGQGGVLIDVRDPSEFARGALPGARNIPLGSLPQHVEALKALERPIIVYCEQGGRARLAHGLLSQRGACGLHNLGGIARWQN